MDYYYLASVYLYNVLVLLLPTPIPTCPSDADNLLLYVLIRTTCFSGNSLLYTRVYLHSISRCCGLSRWIAIGIVMPTVYVLALNIYGDVLENIHMMFSIYLYIYVRMDRICVCSTYTTIVRFIFSVRLHFIVQLSFLFTLLRRRNAKTLSLLRYRIA